MNLLRVTEIPFGGLAHCFEPPGIPLVEKSSDVPPTTSVLVQGHAGTGKSTLALALAHAIARTSNGMALYLTTEASLSDVEFKAHVLGLDGQLISLEQAAAGTQGTLDARAGLVAVCHLVLEHPESADDTKSTEVLQKDALETAYLLVERHDALPLRALVIDSLLLPEGHPEERTPRSRLVAFLQSIEDRGICPILIEETGAEASEHIGFAVDLVFDLSLQPNPDTGGLVRQLVVSKSRYSDCSPGPHDAVMQAGRPAVWPFDAKVGIEGREPVGFFMPMPEPGAHRTQVVALNRGSLVLSRYDSRDRLSVLRAWYQTPGLRQLEVLCGPTTTIVGPDGSIRQVPASHGPSALRWVVTEMVRFSNANGVQFSRLEYLLGKPRFSLALPELVGHLKQGGLVVVAHGSSSGLQPIDTIADFTGPFGHFATGSVTTPLARDFRSAFVWRSALPGLDRPERRPASPELSSYTVRLREAQEKIRLGEFEAARDLAGQAIPPGNPPAALRLRVEGAWWLHRIGMTRTALTHIQTTKSEDGLALSALGWALAEMGDYENACRVALDAINMDTVHDAAARLFRLLRARFMQLRYEAEPTPLAGRLWAEVAAVRGDLSAAESLVAQCAADAGLDSLGVERLLADVRMALPFADQWLDARTRYEALLALDTTISLDRADILFNLAVIHDRMGEREQGIAKLRNAVEANPLHEPARDRLESFGVDLA